LNSIILKSPIQPDEGG